MSASSATKLYTPEVLALATELARFPPLQQPHFQGEAASRSCGSRIAVDLNTTPEMRISKIGLLVTACAIGQTSAVLCAQNAKGLNLSEIRLGLNSIEQWLGNGLNVPSWPGMEKLAHARNFPARHDAILLPWRAVAAALSNG